MQHIEQCRDRVVQVGGGPQGFYESLGFALTGEYEDGEAMLRLPL